MQLRSSSPGLSGARIGSTACDEWRWSASKIARALVSTPDETLKTPPARRGKQRLRHVVHVHVVARGRAEADDRRLRSPPEVVREDRNDARLAFVALTRAVDVREAADRMRHAVSLSPRKEGRLARPLRSPYGLIGAGGHSSRVGVGAWLP
jgi:hypothetical protein